MTSMNEESNVIQYPKRKHINIGIIIFGFIFIYLIATIILYLTAPHVTIYEVRQGSILKDNAYTGLAVRDETVVYAEESGYANYYVENNSKVRVGTKVYTVSDERLELEHADSDTQVTLTNEQARLLILKIQSYNDQFRADDFGTTYQLKSDLVNSIDKYTSQSKSEQLEALLSADTYTGLIVKSAMQDGIIVYSVDGMEEITSETVTLEQLKKGSYKKTEFSNNHQVSTGEPIYKLVRDDNWQLLIEVSEETKAELEGKSTVKVHFKKDNQELRANLSFLTHMEKPVACLSFEHSMIRYVNERYLDIELILEDESGLKIPKSAETSKEFYVVPKSYLTQGGNSNSDGVMIQTKNEDGNMITQFFAVTVYYEEDEMVYLDPNVFETETVLLKPDSAETFSPKETRSLKGVYCINKGYAVFKQIRILCESDEYYIIEEGNSFGLSNYDHIALDSSSIQENDVVF